MGLTLSRALRLPATDLKDPRPNRPQTIAFAGAGGKTTAAFALAREALTPAVVTSTTHFGAWQSALADRHTMARNSVDVGQLGEVPVTLITGPLGADDRTDPLDADVLVWLRNVTALQGWPLLIEADGSRQKPVKAPNGGEPPIPPFAELVVVVCGLSALGQSVSRVAHRPDIFAQLSSLNMSDPISPSALVTVLLHERGGLKNIPAAARRVALLNQADTLELQAAARAMTPALLAEFAAVIVASLRSNVVHAVHETCAGVVLAAGEASRFGRTKQLLDWHGVPFVRAAAIAALAAELRPVVVVVGANGDAVAGAVEDLPVSVVRNEEWREGQAASIRAGSSAIPPNAGSAVFLLADQPQVTPEVLRALVELHAAELPPIAAPLIQEERRGNPVLFDQCTFSDLLSLRGDKGGRALFSKHHVVYLPWHDGSLLVDVDSEDDYRQLLRDGAG